EPLHRPSPGRRRRRREEFQPRSNHAGEPRPADRRAAGTGQTAAVGGAVNLIGMLHLPPLPGSPRSAMSMAQLIDHALRDAEALAAGGVHGLMLENFGDVPFFPGRVPAETIAAMT